MWSSIESISRGIDATFINVFTDANMLRYADPAAMFHLVAELET
jgi:hypothetical protein